MSPATPLPCMPRAVRHASILDDAREAIAARLGVRPNMVVFTSGGSEANNLAVKGAPVERLLVSAIEHPSVIEAAAASGKMVELVPVTPDGVIDLDALERMLARPEGAGERHAGQQRDRCHSAGARDRCHGGPSRRARFTRDAVQALGKLPVNFGLLGVDLVTISAHKIGGPQGIGALILSDRIAPAPLINGGGQELRRRAGTENIAAASGFAAAARENGNEIRALRDRLESEMEGVTVFSAGVARLPNTTCFAVPGMTAETLLMSLRS